MNKLLARYMFSLTVASGIGICSFSQYLKFLKFGKKKSPIIIEDIPESEIAPEFDMDDDFSDDVE